MGTTSKRKRKSPTPRQAATSMHRVSLAKIKLNFSRYVREVQQTGQPVVITQHDRDAAVLVPPGSAGARSRLHSRPPLDVGSIDELIRALPPLPGGEKPHEQEVRDALDATRADRL